MLDMYGGEPPVCLLAAAVLAHEGRAVGFCLGGSLGVFYADVLRGADSTVFVVSTVLYIAANGLHLRFVRHCPDTPIIFSWRRKQRL